MNNCLRKMNKASCGPDGVPPWILRNCRDAFSPLLTLIFNRSLLEGDVPKCLKAANVIPVPKRSPAKHVTDFRPISILPALSKVFEKLFCNKFVIPCIRDKVKQNQFAYVPGPGKGTSVALTSIYHHVLRFLDSESGCVRVAAVDLSKAFDSLTHRSVIQACVSFNLAKESVKWIASYLSDRCQRVFLKGDASPFAMVYCGVPQGSVIGPILFSIVMDSLTPVCVNNQFFKYADDLTVLHYMKDTVDDNLQAEIEHIESWTAEHSLSINLSKSHIMNVITKKSIVCRPIFLSSSELSIVPHVKILGCIFSSDMKWNAFVETLIKRASQTFYLILNLKRADCPPDLLFRAYCTYIRSILLYAFPAVCNMPSYLKEKMSQEFCVSSTARIFEKSLCLLLAIGCVRIYSIKFVRNQRILYVRFLTSESDF